MVERKAPARKPRKATAPEPTAEPVERPAVQPAPDDHPGYIGDHPDPTPNEHYTLSGVIQGLPVPEHDK